MSETAHVAMRMGQAAGRPQCSTFRHRRVVSFRLGSNSPKRLPTAMTAGTSVTATNTAAAMPTAVGTPRVDRPADG